MCQELKGICHKTIHVYNSNSLTETNQARPLVYLYFEIIALFYSCSHSAQQRYVKLQIKAQHFLIGLRHNKSF